jgi:hypothetical protein
MVSVPLFFSYFSIRIRFVGRKYRSCGHAVDPPVDGVKCLWGCSPLLHHDYQPIFEFRGHGTKVLSRKNMAPSFEDSEQKETCVPNLSGLRGGKNAKRFYRTYNVVLTGTLAVLCCILYVLNLYKMCVLLHG